MDWEKRFVRIKQLGMECTKSALAELLNNENEENTSVRCAIATALSNFPEYEEALDRLVQMLSDPETWVRIRTVQALSKFTSTKAPDYIVQHLEREENEKVRATMVKAIGSFGDEKYIPVLMTYLKDDDARVKANTIEGLGYIKSESVQDILRPYLKDNNSRIKANAARIMLGRETSDATAKSTLEQMIVSEDQYERASAVYAVGAARMDAFLLKLIDLISDKSFVVLRNVTDALSHFGPIAEDLVGNRLAEKDSSVKANCCKILATIGTQKSLGKLIPLLGDQNGEVRSLAEEAIAKIEESSAVSRT